MKPDYDDKWDYFSERTDEELVLDINYMNSELSEPHSLYTLNGIRESIRAAESVQLTRKLLNRRS